MCVKRSISGTVAPIVEMDAEVRKIRFNDREIGLGRLIVHTPVIYNMQYAASVKVSPQCRAFAPLVSVLASAPSELKKLLNGDHESEHGAGHR